MKRITILATLFASLSFAQFNKPISQMIPLPASNSAVSDLLIYTDPSAGTSCPAYNQRYWDFMTGHTWACVGSPGAQVWTDISAAGSSISIPSAGSITKVNAGATGLIAAVAGTDYLTSSSSIANSQLTSNIRGRTCEIHIWGDGSAGALQTSDSETASCYNDSGVSVTITNIRCLADNSSTTTTITPIITGGASNSIVTGALTCGNGSFAAGTLNGTPSLISGATIDANITAAGTAKSVRIILSTSY